MVTYGNGNKLKELSKLVFHNTYINKNFLVLIRFPAVI